MFSMSQQVTLKDIAAKANVSLSTVCRALQGKSDISETTKKIIVKIAEELGYRPNTIARSLRLKRTNVLGVIIPDTSNPYFANLLRGIEEAARKRSFSIVIVSTQERAEYEKEAIATLTAMQVDGIVTVPLDEFYYKKLGIPFIFLSRSSNTSVAKNANYLVNDDCFGEYLATRHLIERGFSKIYFINGPRHIPVSTQRYEGYKRALEEAGIEVVNKYVLYGNISMQDGYNAFGRIACVEQPPFAVVCYSDYVSLGVVHAVTEFGFEIPGQVAIVGYDDIDMAAFAGIPLTTIRQAKFDMGSLGTDILIDLIKHKDKYKDRIHRVLKPEIVVRKTT